MKNVADNKIYPLKMRPVYKDYLWGGENLHKIYGKGPEFIAESWEASDNAAGKSIIDNGALKGKTIGEAAEILGISARSIQRVCRRNGIPWNSERHNVGVHKYVYLGKVPNSDLEQIRKLASDSSVTIHEASLIAFIALISKSLRLSIP